MANLTLKTTFTLVGLNKKDIKGSKSTVLKTYLSRAKKELADMEYRLQLDLERKAEVNTQLNNQDFSKYDKHQLEVQAKYNERDIEYHEGKIAKDKKILETGTIPDEAWCLWFAFDCEATNVYGVAAKELFNLLSDGQDHNIKGDICTGANQYEITYWEEF